jgi:DNA-binding XRE family transcriptional regulator
MSADSCLHTEHKHTSLQVPNTSSSTSKSTHFPAKKMQPQDSSSSPEASPRGTAASDQTLASVIKRLRLERGVTQEALAFSAEVTIATLSRIERGVTNPAWLTLTKIAKALDITPAELVSAAEDAHKQPPEEG